MNNVIEFPFDHSMIFCIKEYKTLVDLGYKNMKTAKENYTKLRSLRCKYKYRDIETGEIIRTKEYLKILRLRTKVKKTMYDNLICLAESLNNLIMSFILYLENLLKHKVISRFYFKHMKNLISCLIKKISFILKRCSDYNNKRIYKIKTSKKTTLNHCIKVYSYQDMINQINEDLALISPYHGSIDDIKISNRKDYVKEIYDNLVKNL